MTYEANSSDKPEEDSSNRLAKEDLRRAELRRYEGRPKEGPSDRLAGEDLRRAELRRYGGRPKEAHKTGSPRASFIVSLLNRKPPVRVGGDPK